MCKSCGKTYTVLFYCPLVVLFGAGRLSEREHYHAPIFRARLFFSVSRPPNRLCVSAGFSPIDTKWASKKNGSARALVHTAYTTFPQAAKSRDVTPRGSQLHAFAEERTLVALMLEV